MYSCCGTVLWVQGADVFVPGRCMLSGLYMSRTVSAVKHVPQVVFLSLYRRVGNRTLETARKLFCAAFLFSVLGLLTCRSHKLCCFMDNRRMWKEQCSLSERRFKRACSLTCHCEKLHA